MSQVLVGRVIQFVGELSLLAFRNLEARMGGLAAESPAPPEQPHHPVAAPVPTAQQMTMKEIAPLHAIGRVPRRHHDLRQLGRELGSDALIGIERKYPLVPCSGDT